MTISRDARQLYEESGAIASLSALSDEVQPYRLESFQTLQKNVRDFIIAVGATPSSGLSPDWSSQPFCKYALNNDCRRGVAHLFTAMETSLSICLYVSLIGFIVALPIIPLAVFHSVKLKVTIAILATILNFPLYAFMFHPTTPTLVIICAR